MSFQKMFMFGCVVFALISASVAAEDPAIRFAKVADRLIQAYNKEDYPGIQQDFSDVMLKALPLDKSTMFFKSQLSPLGKIKKTNPPVLTPPDKALVVCYFERAVLDMTIVLDRADKIIGLWFKPHIETVPAPEHHLTVLRLPFDGAWTVFWGGDTREINQHHDVQNQRYAFDFLICDSTGKTYRGSGVRNEDYLAFGQPVLSPADGVVTDVITGVRDNVPGSMNPYSALGNAVCIEHRANEVSVIAHFKHGSILVKTGDMVKKGQILGLCGNSGNSSEAHIHYHLQNTPIIQNGTGIKCIFERVNVSHAGSTESKVNYSPVKGDTVKPE